MKKILIAVAVIAAILIAMHLATRSIDAPGLLRQLHGG